MKTAVLFITFGEPEKPTMEEVVPFLERIFMMNMPLEGEPQRVRDDLQAVNKSAR